MTPHLFTAWAVLRHRVLLPHRDDPSGELTVLQVGYFTVPSLEHPGTSGYFPYRKGDPRTPAQAPSQLNCDFALMWEPHAVGGGGDNLCNLSPETLPRTRASLPLVFVAGRF